MNGTESTTGSGNVFVSWRITAVKGENWEAHK